MFLTEKEKTSFMSARPHAEQTESTRGAAKRKAAQEKICKDLAAHEQLEQEVAQRAPRKALPRRLRRCW